MTSATGPAAEGRKLLEGPESDWRGLTIQRKAVFEFFQLQNNPAYTKPAGPEPLQQNFETSLAPADGNCREVDISATDSLEVATTHVPAQGRLKWKEKMRVCH